MLARELPREWQAVSAANAQTVDLNRLASATIPQDLIAQGDVISVDIALGRKKEDDVSVKPRVKANGDIDLPHIGSVQVMGLNMLEAEDAISTMAIERGVYRNPQVTVSMLRPKMNRITVIGAVKKEGTIELRPGNSDLLQAITLAGGLSDNAGTMVEVRHPGFQPGTSPRSPRPSIAREERDGVISAAGESLEATPISSKSIKVDLTSIGQEGVGIPTLTDGMVVSVNKLDLPPLTVDGLVKSPGQYEFPIGKNVTVIEAIALAHGIRNPVADKIFVVRKRPGAQAPGVIQVSYRRAVREGAQENLLLQPGDVVLVEQTAATVMLDTLEYARFSLSGRLF